MKRNIGIYIIALFSFFTFLFFPPVINDGLAQDCGGPCEEGYSCQILYEDQGIYSCQPSLQQGNKCNPADNQCVGDQSCIPDAPGSETGTCKKPEEGSLCNPGNLQSCGSHVFSPLFCKTNAEGVNACTRITCDPAKKHEECKERPGFYCISEADGKAYCKHSTINPDDYCDRLEVGTPCYQEDPNRPTKWCVADSGGGQPTCKELKNPPPLPTSPAGPCARGEFKNNRCLAFTSGLGNFATDAAGFLKNIFGILLAASGAIALLLIIRAGYKIMTSQGKPEPLQEGKDQLTAAIVGLLFLIFAFVFLELIGVNLLRIPGFGGSPASAPNTNLPKDANCSVGMNQCAPGLVCRNNGNNVNGAPGKCLNP